MSEERIERGRMRVRCCFVYVIKTMIRSGISNWVLQFN